MFGVCSSASTVDNVTFCAGASTKVPLPVHLAPSGVNDTVLTELNSSGVTPVKTDILFVVADEPTVPLCDVTKQ